MVGLTAVLSQLDNVTHILNHAQRLCSLEQSAVHQVGRRLCVAATESVMELLHLENCLCFDRVRPASSPTP